MPLSPRAVAAALVPETEEREICLLTITHPDWAQPLRLSTDPTQWLRNDPDTDTPMYGTVSRGQTYEYLPMQPVLPDSRDDAAPSGKVSISNVSRLVAPHLLTIGTEYPRVTVEVVLASQPDVVDQVWPEMELTTASIDANNAEVSIAMHTAQNEAMPWLRFVPAYFPNLFD